MKKQTSREIARLFADKIEDSNLISELFDYLQFDCKIRTYIDPDLLDESIKSFYETKSEDTLNTIIEIILAGKEASCIDEVKFLRNVKAYIIDHLHEDVSVEKIASEFHVSYYYLCHLFKKLTNKTVNQFKTEKLLEKAIRKLIETDEKISSISTSCGFDNFSYFSEVFIKFVGVSPSEFRKMHSGRILHHFYDFDDMSLSLKMQSVRFLNCEEGCKENLGCSCIHVHDPGEAFGYFLHEAAIIAYKGVLYASWYNCPEKELVGYTPIVGRRSYDGGKTWTQPEIIAEDKSSSILYCPPVYGICDGKLYLLLNQMVSPDHIHSLDLYVLNEYADRFEFIWSRPIPFKLNTNVVTLPNGKLLLPGRVGELNAFPNTPAVMISDSGKIDAEWRLVKVAEDGNLPDGERLVHPETTVICLDNVLYLFNRNDRRRVPLVYISNDFGESWSEAIGHDIPYVNSKIYGGTLQDGRAFLVANTDRFDRSNLVLYLSDKDQLKFTRQIVLTDGKLLKGDVTRCHYPAAIENDGKLYIIATANYAGEELRGRGAVLFKVDLK